MFRLVLSLLWSAGFILLLATSGLCQGDAKPVPKEVEAISGTFTGTWTMYGVDGQGQVIKRGSWVDTMKAERPVMKDDRAYVTTVDEMIFEGRPTPMKIDGREGYIISREGGLGDYFIETFGQVIRMQQIAPDTWVYSTPANPRELAPLGFANVSSGRHVVVKVVSREEDVETHRITRVTTVNWKDQDGKDRWIQYVSLQGVHKRKS